MNEPAHLPPGDLTVGEVVGDWRIEQKLAAGGMGTVYAAVHTAIGKHAAIKVVHHDVMRRGVTVERFLLEARVVNEIEHPNIVDVFSFGTLTDGRPYLVMELLSGCSLADQFDQRRPAPPEAIAILLQVCEALEAAHARGVVHRDLKPENIVLVRHAGRLVVKLVDWGIAKVHGGPLRATTDNDGLVGTPQYIAPEQARCQAVDGRTDIYSLGVVAYELFCGVLPFASDSPAELMMMHLVDPPPPPARWWPDIPPALDRLLRLMLAKEPGDRPTLGQIMNVLQQALVSRTPKRGMDALPTEAVTPIAAVDTGRTRHDCQRINVAELLSGAPQVPAARRS
jgi:serine/threonine-protein kinase